MVDEMIRQCMDGLLRSDQPDDVKAALAALHPRMDELETVDVVAIAREHDLSGRSIVAALDLMECVQVASPGLDFPAERVKNIYKKDRHTAV